MPASRSRSRRRRLALAIPAVALAPVVLAACKLDVDADTEHKASSTYDVTDKATRVSVATTAGKVTVTEKDVSSVKVTETRHWEKGKEPTTSHTVTDGTVNLAYKCDNNDACWVSYDVEVPRGTATHVETDAGEVRLTDLSGDLDVATTAGRISGTGLASKQATARTTAGALDLSFAKAPANVDAKTTAGRATVRVPGTQSYAVDIDASVGDTEVGVPNDANAPSKIKVRTTAGQARVLTS
ncbi:MAG: DUF4097 family beta strand repeat protein [Streptomycetaceae bacterium]|nr:DUF4097 family beta strand repeat protein [Streptomycetaceae bacterium]